MLAQLTAAVASRAAAAAQNVTAAVLFSSQEDTAAAAENDTQPHQMNMLHRGLMQLKMNCSVMLLLLLEMAQKLRIGIARTQDNMVATTADTQE